MAIPVANPCRKIFQGEAFIRILLFVIPAPVSAKPINTASA